MTNRTYTNDCINEFAVSSFEEATHYTPDGEVVYELVSIVSTHCIKKLEEYGIYLKRRRIIDCTNFDVLYNYRYYNTFDDKLWLSNEPTACVNVGSVYVEEAVGYFKHSFNYGLSKCLAEDLLKVKFEGLEELHELLTLNEVKELMECGNDFVVIECTEDRHSYVAMVYDQLRHPEGLDIWGVFNTNLHYFCDSLVRKDDTLLDYVFDYFNNIRPI